MLLCISMVCMYHLYTIVSVCVSEIYANMQKMPTYKGIFYVLCRLLESRFRTCDTPTITGGVFGSFKILMSLSSDASRNSHK